MNDPVLEAIREYERAVAPAYEVIRRARARLVAQVAGLEADPVPVSPAWAATADPTEPNGAEYSVEGIEQPEQADGAPSELDPAPASQPVASVAGEGEARSARDSASPGQPPAGERRSDRTRSAPASATTPPAVSLQCPECDRTFAPHGLGIHRSKAHGVAGSNGHRPTETFLCGRCNRSFPTREALRQHETQVDCQPVPTRPPMGREELVLPGSTQARGLGE